MLVVPTNDLHVIHDPFLLVYFDALEIIEHCLSDTWMHQKESYNQSGNRSTKIVSLILLVSSVYQLKNAPESPAHSKEYEG
jgi:hypothetical protein